MAAAGTDAAHMGIWERNMLTGALTWSEHVEPIFGRAPGTFAGTVTAYPRAGPPGRSGGHQAGL